MIFHNVTVWVNWQRLHGISSLQLTIYVNLNYLEIKSLIFKKAPSSKLSWPTSLGAGEKLSGGLTISLTENESCSVVSDSFQPRGLQPSRLLCPWDFPGKNAGVGCHALLQPLFAAQALSPYLLSWQTVYQGATREAPRTNYGFCLEGLSSASLIMKSIANLWRPSPRWSTVPSSYRDTVGKPADKGPQWARACEDGNQEVPRAQPFLLCLPNTESCLHPLLLSASFLALLWGDQLLLIVGSNVDCSLMAVSSSRSAGHHQRLRSTCCSLNEDSTTLLIYSGWILLGSDVLAVVGSLGSETLDPTISVKPWTGSGKVLWATQQNNVL